MEQLAFEPLSYLLPVLTLLGAGTVAGLLAGMLGVGGGIVIVPSIYYLSSFLGIGQDVVMHVAVGSSLATIIPTGFSSVRSHYRRGAVDGTVLKSWGLSVAIGVMTGTIVAGSVHSAVLTTIFGVLALMVAVRMAWPNKQQTGEAGGKLPQGWPRQVIAFLIGSVSAMMGIGGGSFSVPVLTACGWPIRRAVGTSSAIGLIIAVPGAIGFVVSGWGVEGLPPFSLGYVSLPAVACFVPSSILAAPLGAKIAHTIRVDWLKRAFAVFLGLTAIKMLHSLIA